MDAKVDLASEYAQSVAKIAARTPLVEIYRTAVYSICQLYVNGAIDESQAYALFASISQNVVAKMDDKSFESSDLTLSPLPPQRRERQTSESPMQGAGAADTGAGTDSKPQCDSGDGMTSSTDSATVPGTSKKGCKPAAPTSTINAEGASSAQAETVRDAAR